MTEIVLTIASSLSITPIDVYALACTLILWWVFLALGIQKTYEAYFGLIVGLAIYLMLTVLLSPGYQTPETAKIISPSLSKFLTGSSVYLIFILFLLTPISGSIRFPETKSKILRYIELTGVALFVLVLFASLIVGFALKTYVFNIDTWFVLLRRTELFTDILAGKAGLWIASHIQPVVLFGVLFLLYKVLFSEIIGAVIAAIWQWILSLRNRSNTHAWAADHHADDHGGHEEDFWHDDFDLHEDIHDDHGHGGHGGGHH